MREIKFRAWDKEEKMMIYQCQHPCSFNLSKGNWSITLWENEDIDSDESTSTKPSQFYEPLMQFTGLKDKNGKEIYEGDIVAEDETFLYDGKDVRQVNAISVRKVSNYEYWGGSTGTRWFGRPTHTVQWKQDSCGFEPFSDSEKNCGHCGAALNAIEVEVIGNIYENPELLKV